MAVELGLIGTVEDEGALGEWHTMGGRLPDYVFPKLPPKETLTSADKVIVTFSTEPADFIHEGKPDKFFNWRRPFWEREGSTLRCVVPAGRDYVYHYSRLVEAGLALLGSEADVELSLPSQAQQDFFVERLFQGVRIDSRYVLLGYVEKLFQEPSNGWSDTYGLRTSRIRIAGTDVLAVGCEFSYWGDLSGSLVSALIRRGVRDIVYVGKLGALDATITPNNFLATGHSSTVEGRLVEWDSVLAGIGASDSLLLTGQRHITVPSVVDETKAWWLETREAHDLVDPEVGQMARAAVDHGARFDYLHLVTDNLSGDHREGLYDERTEPIAEARRRLLAAAERLLAARYVSFD